MPLHVVPGRKSKTELFLDILSGSLGGIMQGQQMKRSRTREDENQAKKDAMQVWQMAQNDPLILQDPQVKEIFKKAKWPMPAVREPMSVEQAFSRAPEGYEATITVDPRTGTEKITYKPKDWSSELDKMDMMEIYPERFPESDYGGTPLIPGEAEMPAVEKPGEKTGLLQWLLGRKTAAATAPTPAVPDRDFIPTLPDQLGQGRPSRPAEPFIGPSTPPGFVNRNRLAPAPGDSSPFMPPPVSPSRFGPPMVGFGSGIEAGALTPAKAGTPKSGYKIGQIIPRGGQRYKVVGFDTDGEPLVEKL